MSENNMVNAFDEQILQDFNIPEDQLPSVIEEQFRGIIGLDEQIALSHENCERARELAAQQLRAKRLNTNEALNSTQDAVISLAEAQATLANAQKLLFAHQQKMADSMRYLLLLGASNMAMSRMVVEELEKKLAQAQHEKLSEQTKQELIGIIKLLREQESAFTKQDRMEEQIADIEETIELHQEEIQHIHDVDERQELKDAEHDERIQENAEKNNRQDIQIEAGVKHDMAQDAEMQRQRDIDLLHDKQIIKIRVLSWVAIGIATVATAISILSIII